MSARKHRSAKEREQLSADRLRSLIHYTPETGEFVWRSSEAAAGTLSPAGYLRIKIDGRSYMAHRLAWLYTHDVFPLGHIDHVNGQPEDNRLSNLRQATNSQNRANARCGRNNLSGRKGVSFHPSTGRWRARIRKDGVLRSLGLYATADEAHAAYARAAITAHGEFARAG